MGRKKYKTLENMFKWHQNKSNNNKNKELCNVHIYSNLFIENSDVLIKRKNEREYIVIKRENNVCKEINYDSTKRTLNFF